MYRRSSFRDPVRQIVYVLIGSGIVYAILVYRLGWPTAEDFIFYYAIKIFVALRRLPSEFTEKIPGNMAAISLDFWIFFFTFIGSLAFFSQFVLPLKNNRERFSAFWRLILYIIKSHGPAVFIENGDVRQRKREAQKRGPGVILLDTASAAVLRSPLAFTRAVGPGTVFTNKFEKVAGSVDLHRQSQFIGPHPDEDPFKGQGKDEIEEDFKSRQLRRWETSGLTRDGMEVVPNIFVLFKLESKPDEGGTSFGYNQESVWRAVIHEGVDPIKDRGDDKRSVSWNKLPAYLVVDLWREYLRKFTLDELFTYTTINPDDGVRKTAYQIIVESIRRRMTNPRVEDLDDLGKPTGKTIPSREYDLLRERGLKVFAALVINLRFPDPVDEHLIALWRANWLDRAREEARFVQQRRRLEEMKGFNMALVDFSESAIRLLASHLHSKPELDESLEYLLRGILDECILDTELLQHLTNETQEISDLINWVRRR